MSTYSVYIEFFKTEHKHALGHPYMVIWGKDNAIMKQLEHIYGAKKLTKLISVFFQELKRDKFLQSTGASIGIFKSQIPKLLMKLGGEHIEGAGKW